MRNVIIPALLAVHLCANCAYTQPEKPSKGEYKVAGIGFYNLENLFDTLDNPVTNDADFLPNGKLLWNTEKYLLKQANMAQVIRELGAELTPDGVALLGVAEVENRKVLEDLVSQAPLRDRNYQVVLIEGPDERGINCGLLYQPKYFQVDGARSVTVDLTDPRTGERDFTRDILLVSGRFDGEPLHVMVCHWPSRRGGESASAWARAAAADRCKALADSLRQTDPAAKIVVMGDLNDDPNNKSLTKHLYATGDLNAVRDDGFFNTMYEHFRDGNGTLAYRDSWNLFDQICISKSWIQVQSGGWTFFKSVVFRKPWMIQADGTFKGYPFRTFSGDTFINGYSDHLPVYMVVVKKK
ncbi:MAG: endonuclease/exonuclease/phosphatase family protein [Saprospiraceae bacterium]|nr:endonuclease/exonuclease/phosphatase family protein [Saprospiraceae bacterium]